MKALVYEGPAALAYRDVADPKPGKGEVEVIVDHVGICGSDMHAYLGHDARRPAPLILGHEAAGRLVDGRRVAVNPLVNCGTCDACQRGRENLCPQRQIISMPPREGAFAERLSMPEINLVDIPDHVPTEKAALTEPLACGWHAVRLIGDALDRPLAEARCLVIGGGAIGLGAALCLRASDATMISISEPSTERRQLLASAGDFNIVAPQDAPTEVDVVIDAVGLTATRAASSAAVRPGGVIAHIGLGGGDAGLDTRRMTLQEITFFGTYTYTRADFRATAAALFDGRLGPLDWIDIRALADGADAFDDLRNGRVASPKIVLKP